jgi:hypothetical protein
MEGVINRARKELQYFLEQFKGKDRHVIVTVEEGQKKRLIGATNLMLLDEFFVVKSSSSPSPLNHNTIVVTEMLRRKTVDLDPNVLLDKFDEIFGKIFQDFVLKIVQAVETSKHLNNGALVELPEEHLNIFKYHFPRNEYAAMGSTPYTAFFVILKEVYGISITNAANGKTFYCFKE